LKDSTEDALAGGSQDGTQKSSFDPNAPKPKREFLKRKKPAYVPPNPSLPPKKSYKYYSDAIKGGETAQNQSNRASSRQEQNDFSTNPDSNSRRTANSGSNNRRAQTAHPTRSNNGGLG